MKNDDFEDIARTREALLSRGWEEVEPGVYVRSQALKDSDTFDYRAPIDNSFFGYLRKTN